MNKTDFDNKITSFNNWISSNKAKHLEVQKKNKKKLNTLKTKDYNSFWDSGKGTDSVLSCRSKEVINSKLKPWYIAFF